MQQLVAGVRDDQWHEPTPCTDWDVRQLVAHVIAGNRRFTAMAGGERQGAPLTPEELATYHIGDDAAASYRASAEALREAFSQPGVLERILPSPLGDQPGAGLVQMRVVEHLVHGWDLARATAQQPAFPDELAERTLAGMRSFLEGRPREGGPFKAPQPVADDAPPLDRLAAFLGRSV